MEDESGWSRYFRMVVRYEVDEARHARHRSHRSPQEMESQRYKLPYKVQSIVFSYQKRVNIKYTVIDSSSTGGVKAGDETELKIG